MAWNDSGGSKNPWDRGRGQDGPPDLDKIVRDWQRKLSALLGGRKGGGSGGGGEAAGRLPLAAMHRRSRTSRAASEQVLPFHNLGFHKI